MKTKPKNMAKGNANTRGEYRVVKSKTKRKYPMARNAEGSKPMSPAIAKSKAAFNKMRRK